MDNKNNSIFNKLKRQNGEKFAKALRIEAPIAFEDDRILDIVKHAGNDENDVKLISKTVHSLLSKKEEEEIVTECPLSLLDKAGYNAYFVTDAKSQDAIKKYFASDEELCTFGSDRWKNYNIINAVKKDVDLIKRSDFKEPKRQDAYGTSVISIQCRNGFISIKNRYNHKVPNCDATFSNNPDNIIKGLKSSIENKFKIKLGNSKEDTPDGFIIAQNKLFKVVNEINGIYYGVYAIIKNGEIIEMKEHEYLYEYFIFNMQSKTLKRFNNDFKDQFADDFNKYYGGKSTLRVDRGGNLCDGDIIIIGVEK